jgi:hypothetical protein
MIPEFTLPTDWDHCSELLINDEEFSAASTEVSMIYEQFQMEQDVDEYDEVDQADDPTSFMEVDDDDDDDEQIILGSNMLLLDDDEIFHDPCLPPSGGMEYLESISLDDRFSLSLLEEEEVVVEDESCSTTSRQQLLLLPPEEDHATTTTTTSTASAGSTTTPAAAAKDPLFEQERYKMMLDRLAESMRRSQETRKSLTIHTAKTQDYYHNERRTSLSGVLSSVEKSTTAIQERLLHSALS